MATQVSYPGVYIEEFAPGAPIEGVGTATAAFIGPLPDGPMNQAIKITSWDMFNDQFGRLDPRLGRNVASPMDGYYLWYTVRGYFENNGQVCYVLRASNGKYDSVVLKDRATGSGKDTLLIQARTAGDNSANQIKVQVSDSHSVIGTGSQAATLFRPSATVDNAAGSVIKVTSADAAAQFLASNTMVVSGGGKTDTVEVASVDNDLIRLRGSLSNAYATADHATVVLTGLKTSVDDTFRVVNGSKLVGGSVIKLTQNPAGGGNAIEDVRVVKSVDVERISPTLTTYRVTLKDKVAVDFDLSSAATDVTVESQEFRLRVTQATDAWTYDELSMDPGHPRYFASIVDNDPNGIITAVSIEPPNMTRPPDNRPRTRTTAFSLSGGAQDDPSTMLSDDYKNALRLLEAVDDVNMVVIPDGNSADIQLAILAHCDRMQDRFAILCSTRHGLPMFGAGSVDQQRNGLDSPPGYAAMYYPWLWVARPGSQKSELVPPVGHVAGVYARIDGGRGVFKAPAGVEAQVNGVLGVETTMSDIDQGQLNLHGINVIRVFKAGGRATIWGARTTSPDTTWRYVNVRRLFFFLEKSIQRGIRWAVFEPNMPSLWEKLKRSIYAFLLQQWRDGAIFGRTPEEAFYIRIDEVLNPDSQRALGRLTIEIGIRPAYPAEFIIVRIGIWQGGTTVQEE